LERKDSSNLKRVRTHLKKNRRAIKRTLKIILTEFREKETERARQKVKL